MKANSNRIIESWRYANAAYFVLGLVTFFYLYCIRQTSMQAAGHTAQTTQFIISLSLGVPDIIIWLLAARGAIRFKEYANGIRASKDGAALSLIANALLWLGVYVVLLSFGDQLLVLVHDKTWLKVLTVAKNHLPIVVALISTLLFWAGTRRLNAITPLHIAKRHAQLMWVLIGIFSLAFTVDFLRNQPVAPAINGISRFAASKHVMIFTYIIPYIIIWCLGAHACLSLTNYARQVKGTIYRKLFGRLAKGLAIVFISTFLAQLIIATNFDLQKFTPLLAAAYLLLLFGAYGFLLIYRGADNLHRLEKV